MALLAEEIVEEWLNRQGYFTIRGIRVGVDEIDILAVKPSKGRRVSCRHIEVQCSMRPIGYISKLPKKTQKKTGRPANTAARRSREDLINGVREWVKKKYESKGKVDLLKRLYSGKWSRELVVNKVRDNAEVNLIKDHHKIKIFKLSDIVSDLQKNDYIIRSARGADLVDLVHIGVPESKNKRSH